MSYSVVMHIHNEWGVLAYFKPSLRLTIIVVQAGFEPGSLGLSQILNHKAMSTHTIQYTTRLTKYNTLL